MFNTQKCYAIGAAIAIAALAAQPAVALAPSTFTYPDESHSATQTSALSRSDREFIEKQFATLRVGPEAQERLISKIEQGQLPDSDSGEVDPTSERKITQPDGSIVIEQSFPDGSKSRTSLGNAATGLVNSGGPKTESPTASVSNCSKKTTYSSAQTSYWEYCKIEHQAITWSMSFRSTFTFGNYSQGINSYSEGRTGGIGMGSGKFSLIRKNASGSGTAVVELRARQTQTIGGIGASRDLGLRLTVGRGGPSVSHWGS